MSLHNAPQLIQSVVDRLVGETSVKKVYGEPVTNGKTTVIPVARVAVGFGSGYGEGRRGPADGTGADAGSGQGEGGGLGGGLLAEPVGYIEITPEGSRYRSIKKGRYIAFGLALGFLAGKLLRR